MRDLTLYLRITNSGLNHFCNISPSFITAADHHNLEMQNTISSQTGRELRSVRAFLGKRGCFVFCDSKEDVRSNLEKVEQRGMERLVLTFMCEQEHKCEQRHVQNESC